MIADRLSPSGITLPNIQDPEPKEAAILAEIAAAMEHHEAGRYWQAQKAYQRIADKHNSPRARALLGLLMQQMMPPKDGDPRKLIENPEAMALMKDGADADINDTLVQKNWGAVLFALGRTTDAIAAYQRAIEAWPGHGDAYVALGCALMDVARQDEALYAYQHAVMLEPKQHDWGCDLIFITDLAPSTTFASALTARRRFNDALVTPLMPTNPTFPNDRDPDRKLRIGYASADMYQHSGLTTWGGWLIEHDREKFHVTLYSGTQKEDNATEVLKTKCDQWYDIKHWSEEKLAEQVRKDEIDIFVDLAGFSNGGRILAFARRPAPVQLSGWGYATGMALDCFDAFATDKIVVPENVASQYHEQPWYLPSALSWVPANEDIVVGHLRAALGRPFTFGVFNRQPKINPSTMAAWVEILRRVPGSRLLVKNGAVGNAQVYQAMAEAFVRAGACFDPKGGDNPYDRLYVETGGQQSTIGLFGADGHYNHLAAHWVVDVMLDPFPQGGGVSTFESLWMGVPLITRIDARPPGRIPTSILHQVGLADWACADTETYIERAVAAAHDIPRLVELRSSLRERLKATPALDLTGYCRLVEAGYREFWVRWCAEQVQEAAA